MEHPATDSTGSIDTNQAGSMFATLFTDAPADAKPEPAKAAPAAAPAEAPAATSETPLTEEQALEEAARAEAEGGAEPEEKAKPEEAVKVTIQVDGKAVELTPEEIAEAYKSGLRQRDYTQKTTAAAEKARAADAKAAQAEAEAQAARQDRHVYAQNLQMLGQQLQGVMQQDAQVDMQRLSVENPSEYVKQLHLRSERQAAFQRVRDEQLRIGQQQQAENARLTQQHQQAQAQAVAEYSKQQRENLLAKLPEWKDSAKAQAEQSSISKYLEGEGFSSEEIQGVNDHRAVLLARKAMQYDKLMAKAKAATSKVEKLPTKAERPGTPTAPTDGRTAAMQRLERSGRPEDAGAIFAQMFGS